MSCDQEYYNDMPGKFPPELLNTKQGSKSPKPQKNRERISSNLIDLDTPIDHEYVNESNQEETDVFEDMMTSEFGLRSLFC